VNSKFTFYGFAKKIVSNLHVGEFWPNVISVLTGSVLAQLIPVLGTLIIARQYAPAEFGIFSAWLGIVLILAVAFTARYETAIAIESDGEPRKLAVVSTLLTTLLFACASFVILIIAIIININWINNVPSILLVTSVPAALVIAAMQTLQSWAAADGKYKKLSAMRIIQAASVTIIQIGVGCFYATANALGVAYLLGVVIGLFFSTLLMPIRGYAAQVPLTLIKNFWSKHRSFPIFSLPADVINTAAAQLPVLIVASRFGAEIAGLLAMTIRMLGAPVGVLGKSVLDVFKRRAASSFRERGECREDYVKTFKVLGLGSIVFFLFIMYFSEALFAAAFGEAWRDSGKIALWLLPLFALSFMASPLSYMVYIAGKQHLDLIWQITLLCMTLLTLYTPHRHDIALQLYGFGYSILYVVYLIMSYRFSLGDRK
jgi:O-antigen/teichoic acid export membrane protein